MEQKIEFDELPEVYKTIAEICGFDAVIQLSKIFGGEQVYFPKYEAIEKPIRNRKILNEFNGYNFKALARKYNLTESAIRKICSGEIQDKRNEEDADQYKFW